MFNKKRKKLVFNTDPVIKTNIVTIVKKGKKQEIDLEQLEKCIELLSANQEKLIKKLSGKLKESYRQLRRYVELLHGNQEYYELLLELIKKNFHHRGVIIPWTIGSYMGGCMVKTSLTSDGCSPLCAGSIKYDDDEDFCDYPVITGRYDNNINSFIFLKDDGNTNKSRKAIVYVNYRSLYNFPGFNNRDKAWFGQNNIKKIFLHGTRDFKEYFNLYPNRNGEPISVDQIKDRVLHKLPTNAGINVTVVLGIAIFIVILLIFLYAYLKTRKKKIRQY